MGQLSAVTENENDGGKMPTWENKTFEKMKILTLFSTLKDFVIVLKRLKLLEFFCLLRYALLKVLQDWLMSTFSFLPPIGELVPLKKDTHLTCQSRTELGFLAYASHMLHHSSTEICADV